MASSEPPALPFRKRPVDWFFALFFANFALTSFLLDSVNAVSRPEAGSRWFLSRLVHDYYAAGTDPLLLANPRWLQTGTFLSAFVFGPFYLVVLYALLRGRSWIRLPAIFYAGMIVESVVLYLSTAVHGDAPLFRQACAATSFDYRALNLPKVFAFNLPYLLVPLAFALRLRRPHPFAEPPTP